MNTFAEVGVLYVYIMLVLLVLGMGFLGFRGLENLLKWSLKDKQDKVKSNKKIQEEPWIRIVFLSATFLFLAIFSIGVLKTVGVGEDQHDHNHTAASSSSMPIQGNQQENNLVMEQLQNQINDMSNQITMMEGQLYNN